MPTGTGRPALVMTMPVITAENVRLVPTERSMPAVMIENVTPMARMPTTDVASTMLMTLLVVRKNGDASVKKTAMMTSAPSARTRWTASDLRMDCRLISLSAASIPSTSP